MNWRELDELYGDKISSDYIEGKNLIDLAFEYYGTKSTSGIKNILKKHNVEIKTDWRKLNKLYGDKISNDYIEGKSLKDLAYEYGRQSTNGIKNILKEYNVELRSNSECVTLAHDKHNGEIGYCGRLYSVKEDFFKEWSSNCAYILGFIYADGNISRTALTIGLQRSDRDILEKIKSKLQYTGDIKDTISKVNGKECNTSVLVITSKNMIDSLREKGITERKSLVIDFPNIPKEFQLDFIRGYFDGDGCIGTQYPKSSKYKTETCQIRTRFCSGSFDFMESIRDVLHSYGLRKVNVTSRNKVNIYEICYSTGDSLKIYDLFYKNENCIFLNRKKDKFDKAIEVRTVDVSNSKGHIKFKM